MDTMVYGIVGGAIRQTAAGVVACALVAVVLLMVAWVLAAGFRPRTD